MSVQESTTWITGEEFGAERLESLAGASAPEALPEHYHQIMHSVRTHAAGKFADDATLMLLAVGPRSRAMASQNAAEVRSSA